VSPGGGNELENLEASVEKLLAELKAAHDALVTRYPDTMARTAVADLRGQADILKTQVASSALPAGVDKTYCHKRLHQIEAEFRKVRTRFPREFAEIPSGIPTAPQKRSWEFWK
jgi:hypothetical protein